MRPQHMVRKSESHEYLVWLIHTSCDRTYFDKYLHKVQSKVTEANPVTV